MLYLLTLFCHTFNLEPNKPLLITNANKIIIKIQNPEQYLYSIEIKNEYNVAVWKYLSDNSAKIILGLYRYRKYYIFLKSDRNIKVTVNVYCEIDSDDNIGYIKNNKHI